MRNKYKENQKLKYSMFEVKTVPDFRSIMALYETHRPFTHSIPKCPQEKKLDCENSR